MEITNTLLREVFAGHIYQVRRILGRRGPLRHRLINYVPVDVEALEQEALESLESAMHTFTGPGTFYDACINTDESKNDATNTGALVCAARHQLYRLARALIDAGCPQTCYTAAMLGDAEVIRKLHAEGVDTNKRDGWFMPPFGYAATYGHVEAMKELIRFGADVNSGADPTSFFVDAVASGNAEAVKLMIDNGADVNLPSIQTSPLTLAAGRGYDDIVRLLIDGGIDFASQRHPDEYPIIKAAIRNRPSTVKLLLEAGADFTVVDREGETALDIARKYNIPAVVQVIEEFMRSTNMDE